jgi:hypothetical protein
MERSRDKAKIKKFRRYVELDRFRKAKKLMSKHSVLVNAALNSRKQTGLHVAAKMGNYDTLRVLLDGGADPTARDSKRRLPLHHAARYCLSKKRVSRALVSDLVSSLVTGSLSVLDAADNKETTCRALLADINCRQEAQDDEDAKSRPRSTRFCEEDYDPGVSWRQKLENEAEDDHLEAVGNWARYSAMNEDSDDGDMAETYDDWADKIYREFVRKRRPPPPPPKKKEPSPTTSRPKLAKPLRLEKKTSKPTKLYAKFCQKFLSPDADLTIALSDLPFTVRTNSNEIVSAVLEDVLEGSANAAKKAIRDELRRWHPDKFGQKFATRFAEGDADAIVAVVTHVSQSLIGYGK